MLIMGKNNYTKTPTIKYIVPDKAYINRTNGRGYFYANIYGMHMFNVYSHCIYTWVCSLVYTH